MTVRKIPTLDSGNLIFDKFMPARLASGAVAPLVASVVPDANLPARLGATALATAIGQVAVPRWVTATNYTAGDKVVSPNGDIVSSIATHTSGASFTPANWNLSPTYAPLASPAFTGTPTGITKSHVGLGNVDNTSDLNKPLSTAETAALALRQGYTFQWANTAGRTGQTGMRSGDEGYQLDTNEGYIYRNAGWRLWSRPLAAFTPTVVSGLTVGNGTWNCVYAISNGVCLHAVQFTLGTTSAVTGNIILSLPIAQQGPNMGANGYFTSTGVGYFEGLVRVEPAQVTIAPKKITNTFVSDGTASATAPFTWKSTDIITITTTYPVNAVGA